MPLKQPLLRCLLLAALCGATQIAHAGDPSARDWIPAPPGTDLTALYLAGLQSHGLYYDGNRIPGDPKVDVQALVFRQMHFGQIGGITVQYEAIVPAYRTTLDMSGMPRDRVTGMGDPQLGAALWFVNDEKAKLWFGWEPFVTLPLGKYDGNHADTSPGRNRWTHIQDFALVKGIGESTYLEGVAEVEFYGNNGNYYGQTLKKNPSLRLMALASTNLTPNTYVGMRYRYETGGREKVDGVETLPSLNSHQLAFEITHQINDAHQVQLQYIHDIKVDNGPRMQGFQFRYVYAF